MDRLRYSLSKVVDMVTDAMKGVKDRVTSKASAPAPHRVLGNTAATAVLAVITRNINHNMIQSYRQNNRGLPLGIGVHQINAARRLEAAAKRAGNTDEEFTAGETRIHAADTVLGIVRRNNETRAQHPKVKKLARSLVNRRVLNVRDFMTTHTARLKENRKVGRLPYRKEVLAA